MAHIKFDVFEQLNKTKRLIEAIISDENLCKRIHDVADLCVSALNAGNKLFFIGNGGSAADAQHMAGEYVSRFLFDRPGLAAIALTTDSSIMTAIGNDYGYRMLFSRQIEALAKEGDVLFAYSTSGNSENVVEGLKVARTRSVHCVGMTGASLGAMDPLCDFLIKMPSKETPIIQEGHLMIGHSICALVEAEIFGGKR